VIDAAVSSQLSTLRFRQSLVDAAPSPGGSSEIVALVPFNFATTTLVLGPIHAGWVVNEVVYDILTPFAGATALKFGTSTNASLFFELDTPIIGIAQQYVSPLIIVAPINDILLLNVSGGALAGAGLLFYRIFTP
jgi:hypothetical protein